MKKIFIAVSVSAIVLFFGVPSHSATVDLVASQDTLVSLSGMVETPRL